MITSIKTMDQDYSTYIDYFEFRHYKPDSTDTKRSSAPPYTSLPGPSIVHTPSPSFLGPYRSSIPIPAPEHGFGTRLSTGRELYCHSNYGHSNALFDHFESTNLLGELRAKTGVTKDINIIASPIFVPQDKNKKSIPAPPAHKQQLPPPYPQHPDRSYSAVAHFRGRELIGDTSKPLIDNRHLNTRNYYPTQIQMNPVSRKSSGGRSCSSGSCCKSSTSSPFYHHNPHFVTIGITCRSIGSIPKRKLNDNSKKTNRIEFSGISGAQAVPSSSSSTGHGNAFQWVVPEKPRVSNGKISKKKTNYE